ncbi:MAG: alpha-amylase [Solirubrobacterales bacterium]|nr:alpha-amylase [Solirubrobacterales bacterium]
MFKGNPVVYQIYPRSFQDSNGDGIGDLPGIVERLDHIAALGADAVWLSPIYPSPDADFGYDVADHTAVDPRYGTLGDFDALVAAAHDRGLALLLDYVPCHTSLEHPWFREQVDFYIRRQSAERPNNWLATFGGPAWDRDPVTGGWYLHTFYPEQPDLDWRNPALVDAMQDVLRFWRARGVDGFRLDALQSLLKDPELRDDPPATEPFPFPLDPNYAQLAHVHSVNAPDIGDGVAAIRAAAGSDAVLVGEVYLPAAQRDPYLPHLDVAFAFELLFCPREAGAVRAAIESNPGERRPGWVLSNHDFSRIASRWGPEAARAAAMLHLTLPGAAFLFQGDELGQPDGPGHDPPYDRARRDPYRHPLAWDETPGAGFSSGQPWLAPLRAPDGPVSVQERDRGSLLWLYRDLIALRRELDGPVSFLDAPPGALAFSRGDRDVVAVNLGAEPWRDPPAGEVLLATHEASGPIRPLAGRVVRS